MDNIEDTFIKNGFMFIFARQNKPAAEKIINIEDILNDGADINCPDANNKNNTILHIATQRDEKEIVEFLLKKGALLLYNLDNKTPVQIAKEKNTVLSKEILSILTEYEKHSPCINDSSLRNYQSESNQNRLIPQKDCSDSSVEILYPKRAGTSGVSGQFYETKLLSLVLHRALHDKVIEECYLAANIRDIGDFDDVCFRFKMQEDGKTKHVMCFMQAKHREDPDKAKLNVDSVRSTSGQFCLIKYFDSFLKIKQKFITKSKTYDPMFEGEFNDIDCYFILYTPLKENFDRKVTGNKPVCHKLHDFINTSEKEGVFQFNYEISDINFLTKFMQQERIKVLGKVFLTFILANKTKDIMTNDLIQIYHPALAQNVIELKESDPNYFEGKFREEFFDTDDDLLITLKETLCNEIVFKRTKKKTTLSKEEVKAKIKDIVNNPSAQTISTLIGEILFFDDKINKLRLDGDKISQKQFKQEDIREINHYLQKCQVTQAMVNDAITIVGKEKLKLLIFKLPYTFGNSDYPSNLKDGQVPKERLKFLAKKFYELIKEKKLRSEEERIKNNEEKIAYPVEISICEHNVGPQKILELSHLNTKGIGGTVGNLLQFDRQSHTFTFNTNEESLGKNSKYMLEEIKKLTQEDLANYKINVKMNNFPQTSFDANENDKRLAEEFLSKLWFYTNQAKEEAVESILKKEIDNHYNANKSQNQFLFRVHSDAIFLRFHDEIQKWWKSQSQARYLTKTDTIFDEAKKDIIDSPVLTVLNVMFIRSLKKLDIEFDDDVINSMNVKKIIGNKKILNILSDAVILSATKIMQLVRFQTNYTFVNLDYVHILPENDYNKLMDELIEMKAVTLIIICETSLDKRHQDTLNKIIEIYKENIIIITDKPLQEKIYQNNEYITFNDVNVNLSDLHSKSQAKVFKEFKVCYQGKEVPLNTIIDDNSKYLIHAKLLWSILNKTKIEIGHALGSHKYDEIKDYYINRSLLRNDEEYEVNTLNDVDDKIVLITSKPCMGKTILLTHLSLETKKIDPQPWIVRINMSAHNNDFAGWPQKNIHVTNVMRFLCKAALKTTNTNKKIEFTAVNDETVEVNKDNLEDISFELDLFVHFYNQGKVIFLFDGFDRIYPHYTKEGMELLIALKRANKRMWITSNCYIINLLERELGTSYKLERLTTIQQESFLSRFWKTNLKLEKLNHEQFNNISIFLNYIVKFFNSKSNAFTQERPMMPLLSMPLHIIYLTAVEYFKNEINSLSPRFLRETIKKKWRLNSYTAVDRFLRPDEEESLELAGTPLHMYIAANYFKLQIKDKFELHIDTDVIINRSNVYLNAITSYERFLKNNIKHICEIKNRNIEREQDKARDSFFETHKKLALYAICKESDISKLLTEPEIHEVKTIIKKIESGEIKTHLIDCVVDGVPRFYNLLFAEYFIVEFATDMLKRIFHRDITHITLESFWNFVVNGVILLCPPGARKAFDYKLKHDPELIEVASNESSDKIIFELILKQNQKTEIAVRDKETSLNIAINDGLVNITNLMLKSARRYVTKDNVDGFLSIFKTGAFILGAANPSWKELTDIMMHCIHNVDGEKLIEIINSTKIEGVSRTLTSLCASTEMGKALHEKIKKEVCEPIKNFTERLIAHSSNNENLTTLVEVLPYHLPDIVNSLFGEFRWDDDQ